MTTPCLPPTRHHAHQEMVLEWTPSTVDPAQSQERERLTGEWTEPQTCTWQTAGRP